jgi:hypothetical protein
MILGTKRIAKTMNSTFSYRFYFLPKNRVFVSSINTFQKILCNQFIVIFEINYELLQKYLKKHALFPIFFITFF